MPRDGLQAAPGGLQDGLPALLPAVLRVEPYGLRAELLAALRVAPDGLQDGLPAVPLVDRDASQDGPLAEQQAGQDGLLPDGLQEPDGQAPGLFPCAHKQELEPVRYARR